MRPFYGWLLTYEWTFFLSAVLYGKFLNSCFRWGRQSSIRIEPPRVSLPCLSCSAGLLQRGNLADAAADLL